jgi:hypothetical protein
MNIHTRSQTVWLWLLLIALLALPLFWLTLPAAGQKGETKTDFENFDIRVRESVGAKAALARALDKLPAKQLAQNVLLKTALNEGARRTTQAQPRLQVSYSQLTNTPEIAQAHSGGRAWLSPPQKQPRENIVHQFLTQNSALYGQNTAQLGKLQLVADYANPAGNLGWVHLEQRWNNLPVFQGELMGALTRDGELVRVVSGLTPGPGESVLPTTAKVSATQAVINAAASLKLTLTPNDLIIKNSALDGSWVIFAASQQFAQDIKVELKYFPLDAGLAVLSWSMILWQDNPAYYTLVSAEDGELLWRKNLTNDQTQPATYAVYSSDSPAPLSPTNALPGSGIQGAAVPRTSFTLISESVYNNLGWMNDGDNTTTGNNVDAGLDLVAPDGIDPGSRPTGSPSRVFDFIYNPAPGIPPPGDAPTLADYRNGEVVNMFFWSNRYHDRLYELGFTEAARNFQNDNFGRGGLGNDRVLAQGQDASGTNNANFSTPPDGIAGRMQMFIFNGPTPDRTSGLDQEVLLHELTHGTSNRLHSNAAGLNATMSGGMGEGWSDFYALSLLSQPGDDQNGVYAMGGYSTLLITAAYTDNYYYGIRRFPHAVRSTVGPNGMPHNPLTFADIDPSQINLTDGAFPRGPIGSANAFA